MENIGNAKEEIILKFDTTEEDFIDM